MSYKVEKYEKALREIGYCTSLLDAHNTAEEALEEE